MWLWVLLSCAASVPLTAVMIRMRCGDRNAKWPNWCASLNWLNSLAIYAAVLMAETQIETPWAQLWFNVAAICACFWSVAHTVMSPTCAAKGTALTPMCAVNNAVFKASSAIIASYFFKQVSAALAA